MGRGLPLRPTWGMRSQEGARFLTATSLDASVSLSPVSVTHSQLLSENVKWKFPEINHKCKLCAISSSVMKSRAFLLHHTGGESSLCLESPRCLLSLPVSHLVGVLVNRWVVRGRETTLYNFCYNILLTLLYFILVIVVHLLLCLIYKLNFIVVVDV